MRPRHVLITGGSRGIGLAIAQLFAKTAYRCTLISRSEKDLKDAVASLRPLPSSRSSTSTRPSTSTTSTPANTNQSGPETTGGTYSYQHSYISTSISEPSFWTLPSTSTSTSTSISPSHPPFPTYLPKPPRSNHSHPSTIDILINCAGISQSSLFTRTSSSDIEQILATNLTSVMIGTRFLLRHSYLRRQSSASDQANGQGNAKMQSPVIINIASLLGLSGGHGAVAYAASKAGVLGFTRALAAEYASHGVRVNAVVPGYVDTGMTEGLNTEELSKRIPLGRFGTTAEIASAALFLAENEYAHNCVLNLDGGLSTV
ncbi:NAD(P)-binding protein [Plenodomus tracheiphilus IPT5]|uniref:NAD(P)-binding protein n=1 Tax=Plenodomus tracheiphilus IPT5 TaxID=1408161 RepID=A0A6A7BLX7_9PLEO|nr:NAD(P)-binding protein [Plenodomus tracheiphilus IPT5]